MPSLSIGIRTLVCLLLLHVSSYAQKGLKAEYFNDMEFRELALTRIESKPYLNYYLQAPAPGVKAEYFSARWTGKITAPATGEYTFFVRVDDGVRVWINNEKIIESWQEQEAANYNGSIYLEKAKQYDIKIEYYNTHLHAIFMFHWESPADAYEFMGYEFFTPRSEVPANVFSFDTKILKPKATPIPVKRDTVVKPLEKTNSVKQIVKQKPAKKAAEEPVISINESIELKSVHFEQTKYNLSKDCYNELNTLASYLKKHPRLNIKIIGHTDYAGDSTSNYLLSEQRAKAVADYLQTNGIDSQRISIIAMGSSQPRITHKEADQRKQNRRVEFVLSEKVKPAH